MSTPGTPCHPCPGSGAPAVLVFLRIPGPAPVTEARGIQPLGALDGGARGPPRCSGAGVVVMVVSTCHLSGAEWKEPDWPNELGHVGQQTFNPEKIRSRERERETSCHLSGGT